MVWNGVHFNTYTVIPWPVMVLLVAIYLGSLLVYWNADKKRPILTTRDASYIGLAAAILVVYNYFVAPLLPSVSILNDFFNISMIGDIYLLLLVAALVGKPGSVGITIIVFDLLGDITHYGFGGEPFWIIGDVIAYAFIIDMWLIIRKNKFMSTRGMSFLDGVIGGIAYSVSVPLFFMGFWGSFVHGYLFNPNFVVFRTLASLPEGIVFGLLVTPFVIYTKSVVKK
ncbi:MAG: hypothetical protein ACP5NC_02235 [Nitrososphaeria archaeon]